MKQVLPFERNYKYPPYPSYGTDPLVTVTVNRDTMDLFNVKINIFDMSYEKLIEGYLSKTISLVAHHGPLNVGSCRGLWVSSTLYPDSYLPKEVLEFYKNTIRHKSWFNQKNRGRSKTNFIRYVQDQSYVDNQSIAIPAKVFAYEQMNFVGPDLILPNADSCRIKMATYPIQITVTDRFGNSSKKIEHATVPKKMYNEKGRWKSLRDEYLVRSAMDAGERL